MRRTMALQGARAEAALRAHRPASREATFVLGAKDDLQYTPSPSKVVSVHIACFPTDRKGPGRIHKKIAAIVSLILSRATLHLPAQFFFLPFSISPILDLPLTLTYLTRAETTRESCDRSSRHVEGRSARPRLQGHHERLPFWPGLPTSRQRMDSLPCCSSIHNRIHSPHIQLLIRAIQTHTCTKLARG